MRFAVAFWSPAFAGMMSGPVTVFVMRAKAGNPGSFQERNISASMGITGSIGAIC
jgi:hypothetical protein